MSERFLADAVLLNSGGREVARLERLEISQQSAQALTQAVEQRWGQAVWLLHDGGLELGRRGTAARFEVQGRGGAVLPGVPNDRPWQRPGWRAQIGAWLETELNESPQRLTVIHASDIGCVLSMETGQGRRYFKAGEDGREVRAALEAARLFPTRTPEILAADEQRGWLLTRDAGACLLTSVRLNDWRGGVAQLTQVQQGASFAGVPIHRFAELPARAEALLLDTAALTHWGLSAEQLPSVQALLSPFWAAYEHVAALGLPDTPAHGDFHPNNVLIDAEGVVRLFDWSEGCTQHPLLDLGWLLAFVQHPARAEHPVRMALPELAQTLWHDWLSAWKLTTALRWQDAALIALIHRAVVYDARYRSWTGSVPGFRPQFTPYYLNMARHFA